MSYPEHGKQLLDSTLLSRPAPISGEKVEGDKSKIKAQRNRYLNATMSLKINLNSAGPKTIEKRD